MPEAVRAQVFVLTELLLSAARHVPLSFLIYLTKLFNYKG
jgi:hypothetical protein